MREFDLEMRQWEVAGEVDEVDGFGSGREVDGGIEGEEGREDNDGEEIVLEMEPEVQILSRFVWEAWTMVAKTRGAKRRVKRSSHQSPVVFQLHLFFF